ncbi:CLUMA_CG010881, isoform A [Clunio marinus]|uniref:CLUMA_CG010881, isoform A n=1 Tax=Clunio marinus TaxID=568069 RepID=A0A1J1ID60_9DIPT|nr:CLUMA_CG010881, isoform A [Clunio marinus]
MPSKKITHLKVFHRLQREEEEALLPPFFHIPMTKDNAINLLQAVNASFNPTALFYFCISSDCNNDKKINLQRLVLQPSTLDARNKNFVPLTCRVQTNQLEHANTQFNCVILSTITNYLTLLLFVCKAPEITAFSRRKLHTGTK